MAFEKMKIRKVLRKKRIIFGYQNPIFCDFPRFKIDEIGNQKIKINVNTHNGQKLEVFGLDGIRLNQLKKVFEDGYFSKQGPAEYYLSWKKFNFGGIKGELELNLELEEKENNYKLKQGVLTIKEYSPKFADKILEKI